MSFLIFAESYIFNIGSSWVRMEGARENVTGRVFPLNGELRVINGKKIWKVYTGKGVFEGEEVYAEGGWIVLEKRGQIYKFKEKDVKKIECLKEGKKVSGSSWLAEVNASWEAVYMFDGDELKAFFKIANRSEVPLKPPLYLIIGAEGSTLPGAKLKAFDKGREKLAGEAFGGLYAFKVDAEVPPRSTFQLQAFQLRPEIAQFYIVEPGSRRVDWVFELKNAGRFPLPPGDLLCIFKKEKIRFLRMVKVPGVPVGDSFLLKIGEAFNMKVDRKLVSFRKEKNKVEKEVKIEIYNGLDEKAPFKIRERFSGKWKIKKASLKWKKLDAWTVEWSLQVFPLSNVSIEYVSEERFSE